MRDAGLEEAQAGVKIAWRNINNLRFWNGKIIIWSKISLEYEKFLND